MPREHAPFGTKTQYELSDAAMVCAYGSAHRPGGDDHARGARRGGLARTARDAAAPAPPGGRNRGRLAPRRNVSGAAPLLADRAGHPGTRRPGSRSRAPGGATAGGPPELAGRSRRDLGLRPEGRDEAVSNFVVAKVKAWPQDWRTDEQTQAWIAGSLDPRARVHGDVGVLRVHRCGRVDR